MVPLPDASSVSQAKDRHTAHDGRGGWRSVPQLEHRWMSSLCCRAPSKKNELSWVRAGLGRKGWRAGLGRNGGGAVSSVAAAVACAADPVPGLNLRIRNRMVATNSPLWSRY